MKLSVLFTNTPVVLTVVTILSAVLAVGFTISELLVGLTIASAVVYVMMNHP